MTQKESLLLFLNNMDDTQILRTVEMIVNAPEESLLNPFDAGNKTWHTTKEDMINIITNYFDDELIGTAPNDTKTIKILDWISVPA